MEETTIIKWKKRPCARPVWSGMPAGTSAGSAFGPERQEARSLSLRELGGEYARTAAALWERICLVEEALEEESDEQRRISLRGRLRLLRSMHRDTRSTAKLLEHYYDHREGGENHADGLL